MSTNLGKRPCASGGHSCYKRRPHNSTFHPWQWQCTRADILEAVHHIVVHVELEHELERAAMRTRCIHPRPFSSHPPTPAPPASAVGAIARVNPSSSISSHKASRALPLLPLASQAHEESISQHLPRASVLQVQS
jgi:hypothetical protein